MADASPSEIYIALMGVTGVGKSAFISHCADQTAVVGDGLQSCTRRVQVYSFAYSPSVTVHLVDTPGFDDTNRKDSDVLREISAWLSEAYAQQVLLSGILYLHRITDLRMQGSGKMSLALLHKLCGNEALKKLVLVTTMWDREEAAVGEQREQELVATPDFWGFYMQHGAHIRRHLNNTQSAMNIIGLFVPQTPTAAPETITLDIQRELSDERKTLDQTNAGRVLDAAWAREKASLQQELEEVREAMRSVSESRDATMAQLLQEQQEEMDRTVQDLRREQAKLRVNLEQLHAERLQNMEEMLQQQRTITQSLTQDLERMRLAESDRLADQQQAEEAQRDQWREQAEEEVEPEPAGDRATDEALGACLLNLSAVQRKHIGNELDQLRVILASGQTLPTILGVQATGAGMYALSRSGGKDLSKYSVTRSRLNIWCDACRVSIGAKVRCLCAKCQAVYCSPCWREGRACKKRNHTLIFDPTGLVETSCQRLDAPPSALSCSIRSCKAAIEGLYFHCCHDGAELDFCRLCIMFRGRTCRTAGHPLQWGVVPISLLDMSPMSLGADVAGSAGRQSVIVHRDPGWLEDSDAPPRVLRAAARSREIKRGRVAVNAALAAGNVKARLLGNYPDFCDYCTRPLKDYYNCRTRHPELSGLCVAICPSCHANGVQCPARHTLARRVSNSGKLRPNCQRLWGVPIPLACDACNQDVEGLYLHCCGCGDNVDLCLRCVMGGATCPRPQEHTLALCYSVV